MEYEEQEEFEQKEKSIPLRIFQGVVAVFLVIGLLYITGVDRFFLYQRTSPAAQQETVESAIDAEQLSVSLSIVILKNEGTSGSLRTKEDAERLVRNADEIWSQANIDLEIKNIFLVSLSDEKITEFIQSPHTFIPEFEYFDSSAINVFLVQHINGINGIAFGGLQSVAVADYTTVLDFRTLAHEIGHILGLGHVNNRQQLMFSGANGVHLSLQEIVRARDNAEYY